MYMYLTIISPSDLPSISPSISCSLFGVQLPSVSGTMPPPPPPQTHTQRKRTHMHTRTLTHICTLTYRHKEKKQTTWANPSSRSMIELNIFDRETWVFWAGNYGPEYLWKISVGVDLLVSRNQLTQIWVKGQGFQKEKRTTGRCYATVCSHRVEWHCDTLKGHDTNRDGPVVYLANAFDSFARWLGTDTISKKKTYKTNLKKKKKKERKKNVSFISIITSQTLAM